MAATSSRFSRFPTTHQGIRDLDQPRQVTRNDPMRLNVGDGERTLSAVGGGGLLTAGLLRGGVSGLAMMWAGAGLLLRGLTGHCMVNEALGRNTA
jgi:uncharacterized membrane protein